MIEALYGAEYETTHPLGVIGRRCNLRYELGC